MVKTQKKSDADIRAMRLKYLPLLEENEKNQKKVDALFIRCFERDMDRFVQILIDARNS